MTRFTTLIFIPEGSILNEKAALQNALRQTLKEYGHDFGPGERLKYTDLQKQLKLLSEDEQISLLLQTFLPAKFDNARTIFMKKMQQQKQLIKGAAEFLDTVHGQLQLILLAKEKRAQIVPRLADSELLTYFAKSYFRDNFTVSLPNKNIFYQILQDNTDIDPDTTMVIGTSLAEEIQGAENANLKSLWLAPKKDKIPITPHPTLHLTKLSDLLFYLDLD
ncbi:HAD hydrolase-like protein [Lactobacillus sp. ESL0791]|uniref:HAD family hydrolase n=1 Tax=Lactobacillus sp. ESL0791 TaxID=2983234 RepID=UPI0023F75929|nr:HAD hydrolase-like protein [Lactobacillus sp. ESL0791]MDF7639398.1 HAD hydrolase-like protein [Lactobacillus sp. ESL0791]